MTYKHYAELMAGDEELSPEDVYEGWHWCREFDGLLVGPGMDEWLICDGGC